MGRQGVTHNCKVMIMSFTPLCMCKTFMLQKLASRTPIISYGVKRFLQKSFAYAQVVVSARSVNGCTTWAVKLEKGARTRTEEDAIASRMLVLLLLQEAGVQPPAGLTGLTPGRDGEVEVSVLYISLLS